MLAVFHWGAACPHVREKKTRKQIPFSFCKQSFNEEYAHKR